MALLVFNSKIVGTNGGLLDYSVVSRTVNSTRTLKSTGRGVTLNSTKGNPSEPAKSDDIVWEEQEEPSLGSGGY